MSGVGRGAALEHRGWELRPFNCSFTLDDVADWIQEAELQGRTPESLRVTRDQKRHLYRLFADVGGRWADANTITPKSVYGLTVVVEE